MLFIKIKYSNFCMYVSCIAAHCTLLCASSTTAQLLQLCVFAFNNNNNMSCCAVPFFILLLFFIHTHILHWTLYWKIHQECADALAHWLCVHQKNFFSLHYLHGMSSSKICFSCCCTWVASCCYVTSNILKFHKKKQK